MLKISVACRSHLRISQDLHHDTVDLKLSRKIGIWSWYSLMKAHERRTKCICNIRKLELLASRFVSILFWIGRKNCKLREKLWQDKGATVHDLNCSPNVMSPVKLARMRWAFACSTHDRQRIRSHFRWENWRKTKMRRTQTAGGIENVCGTSWNEFIWLITALKDEVWTFRRVYLLPVLQ